MVTVTRNARTPAGALDYILTTVLGASAPNSSLRAAMTAAGAIDVGDLLLISN